MKSSLFAGAAVITLLTNLHAEVYVLGASWRERYLAAPEGTIERKVRNYAAPRGYVILEPGAPAPAYNAALIEYHNERGQLKTYTVNTSFTGFKADVVDALGETSRRMFGQIYAPVGVADVANPMMPFSGSVFGNSKPNKLVFDKTVFQTGDSTPLTGPVIVSESSMARSILTGVASNVKVDSTSLAGAVLELSGRLEDSGYERGAVAPVIVDDLDTTLVREGFVSATLSVGLGPDVFPTPTYEWFKGAVAVGSGSTFVVPAGVANDGVYHVVVSTDAGSDTSGDITVSTGPSTLVITTNLPAAQVVPFAGTAVLSVSTNPSAFPQITSYQWSKATLAAPGTFTPITAANGGTQPTYTVSGNVANINGPGLYRVAITNGVTPLTSTSTTVTMAP